MSEGSTGPSLPASPFLGSSAAIAAAAAATVAAASGPSPASSVSVQIQPGPSGGVTSASQIDTVFAGRRTLLCTKHTENARTYAIVKDTREWSSSVAGITTVVALLLALAGLMHFVAMLPSILVALGAVFYLAQALLDVTEEELLVVHDLGVQITTIRRAGMRSRRFIDRGHISDVIINEGIVHTQVVYYLAVVVEGDTNDMAVIYESSLPRLEALLPIYRGTRACLFGESER